MDDSMRERLRALLLDRPGLGLVKVAAELGIGERGVFDEAKAMGLGKQRERLRAAGRLVKPPVDRYDRVRRLVVLRPGLLLHFDACVLGLWSFGEGQPSRDVVCYSMVDRCSGWSFARVCERICPLEAAASLRAFMEVAPFDVRGGFVLTDGRHDVRSEEFLAACRGSEVHQRGFVTGRPYANAIVEHQHRYLRMNCFGALPFEAVASPDGLPSLLAGFIADLNLDRSLVFGHTWRLCAKEIVEGWRALSGLPVLERAVQLRLVHRVELERAVPLASVLEEEDFFAPLAPALRAEDRASFTLEAVQTDHTMSPRRSAAPRRIVRVPKKPGFYLAMG